MKQDKKRMRHKRNSNYLVSYTFKKRGCNDGMGSIVASVRTFNRESEKEVRELIEKDLNEQGMTIDFIMITNIFKLEG